MKSFDLIVAENIKIKLEEQHKKQIELANYLKYPRQIINKMLCGEKTITALELNKIADFFCCSSNDLITEIKKDNSAMKAYFMGNISDESTINRINLIRDLSKIIAEQHYSFMNR